jgi:hypothetical protein
MSKTSLSVIAALLLAVVGFSSLCLSAPVIYSVDSSSENGLVREIVFDRDVYKEMESGEIRLVYRNPTPQTVSFALTFPVVYEYFVDGVRVDGNEWGIPGRKLIEVSLAPGGEYVVCDIGFYAEDVGWNEVSWDGLRRGVAVERSGVVMRLVTDKDRYYQGEGGDATFEYYNPTGHNVTINPPSPIEKYIIYPDGTRSVSTIIYGDWAWGNYPLAPGESFHIYSFHFTTYQLGKMTIVVNGYSKTVEIVPR